MVPGRPDASARPLADGDISGALFRIAEAASGATDMATLYPAIRDILAEVMYADNFSVALYDHDRKRIGHPFVAGRGLPGRRGTSVWQPYDPRKASDLTAYVLRATRPQWFTQQRITKLVADGKVSVAGRQPVESIGAPLTSDGRTIGAVEARSFRKDRRYAPRDLQLLAFAGQQLGMAFTRLSAVEEVRQRNAELSLVNEVGRALAKQLDFGTIIELIGERIRSMFEVQTGYIALFDPANNVISFPYTIEFGKRESSTPIPLGPGLTSEVITSGRPLRMNTAAESDEHGALVIGSDAAESWLGVPILAGDRVLGVIALERMEQYGFSESDERLLGTLASSAGAALESVRLFDETKQLLKETEERNAELAVINSVQQGLASKLEFQAIIDLVGEHITEIFDAQATLVSLYDPKTEEVDHRYLMERGEQLHLDRPVPIDRFRRRVVETRQPWLINQDYHRIAVEMGEEPILEGEEPKSLLFVPMIAGDAVTGVISLQNLDVENAFTEADARLLQTLANAMSITLENARLFDETQRLLAETDERAAELAVINSVQEGLAANLDMQAMYDLVGDKISEIFDAHVVAISIVDEAAGVFMSPYTIERGVRLPDEPFPLGGGFSGHVLETRQPLLVNADPSGWQADHGIDVLAVGEMPMSVLFAPLVVADTVRGVITLQNLDREYAFSDSDVRLLTTLASSLAVALENARLFDETKRLLTETDERAAELAVINSVQQALAANLDMQAMYELVGDKIRDIFDAQAADIAIYDLEAGVVHFPYGIERGVRYPDEPTPIGGINRYLLDERKPIFVNQDFQGWLAARGIQAKVLQGEPALSVLFVPLIVGDEVRGRISLQNVDREDAFSDSDLRLLSTLASSLAVALENARLFDETKRLLTETDERAAELAVINSVQQALAANLDMQAMYELVGEKIRDIFDAQVVDIGIYDLAAGLTRYPYTIERGVRFPDEPLAISGFSKVVLESRQPILVNEDVMGWLDARGIDVGRPGRDGQVGAVRAAHRRG